MNEENEISPPPPAGDESEANEAPAEFSTEAAGEVPEAGAGSPASGAGELDEAALLGESLDFSAAAFEAPPEGENLDPALAVDEMLNAAVLAGAEEVVFSPPEEASSLPTFQLQMKIESSEQREKLKALAQSHSLSVSEQGLVSQLTEFQAVSFRQAALALGFAVSVSIQFPLPALSEDEQALGELALVPDGVAVNVEGAPSVELPKNEKEVLLLTELPAGLGLVETLGVVSVHRSLARRFFREEEAEAQLRKELQKSRGTLLPTSRFEALLREICLDLQKAALRRGGNSVFGVKLEAFPETSNLDPGSEQMRLVAFGTAAVVEKA